MRIRCILQFMIIILCILTCSCALIRKPLDDRSDFSENLIVTENHIRKADWNNAITSLKRVEESWHSIKPILQIDIDHDYINDIENNITKLKGVLQSQEKPDSLSTIL